VDFIGQHLKISGFGGIQHAFEPGASGFNKLVFPFFRFPLGGELFHPLFGIGEESIKVEFKIKSIIK
jgi:hypothetical protein